MEERSTNCANMVLHHFVQSMELIYLLEGECREKVKVSKYAKKASYQLA